MVKDAPATGPTAVCLEIGPRRVVACAWEWPGWCRTGKGEEAALEALRAYGPRYAAVAAEAGLPFPPSTWEETFEIVERIPGAKGYTEMGIPMAVTAADASPLTAEGAERQAALVAASWAVLDRIADGAPAELRKGPRGGGRDRDKLIDHVLGAEAAYARKLGIKRSQPALDDAAAIAALRDDIIRVLGTPSNGAPLTPTGWPTRYAARRIAWHVLDHAWEMEDRSEPA